MYFNKIIPELSVTNLSYSILIQLLFQLLFILLWLNNISSITIDESVGYTNKDASIVSSTDTLLKSKKIFPDFFSFTIYWSNPRICNECFTILCFLTNISSFLYSIESTAFVLEFIELLFFLT